MRVEAYRIGPSAEGYDGGLRYNVDVVNEREQVEHRWQFCNRENTRIAAILEAGKHPCEAWWVEACGRLRICTIEEAESERRTGVLFRKLLPKRRQPEEVS